MRTYILATAAIFGLITLLHIWRAIAEVPHLATEPFFIFLTIAAATLCVWGLRLFWRSRRS